ncbi:MAG: PEP-CTERM sorting domain-containing protein [Ferrovum myxofaciens]|uniref:PEP-CTERM sorting domain-containing protein n=1 Tax=Ferrovum myxofaciens TaxID=416213 RepID=UPI002355F6CF|nr:PEP-CTERM sorting domain-containing protein [Ferrovum myxofaciens]QKE40494.1 MAG: PEP-CTERM sorting domain-containing protein [Ferrovum myxofaciens]
MIKTAHNTETTLTERVVAAEKMKSERILSKFLVLVAGVSLSAWSVTGEASTITDNLYYTMENQGNTTGNIFETTATVSSQTGAITYSNSSTPIAATGSGTTANGIVMNPTNGQLLVGGGQSGGGAFPSPVYQVNPTTGAIMTATDPGYMNNSDMAVGPNNKVWATGGAFGSTGPVASFPINPFGGSGTVLSLTGSDTAISSLAFDPKNNTMYYTSGGLYSNSIGNFGTLNLFTGKTTAILTNQPGLYGLAYDPFSGDLIATGNDLITQITTSGKIISQLNLNYLNKIGTNIGWQLANVDPVGNGQLFVVSHGSQSGYMQYVNYASTGLVGDYNYTSTKYLGFGLDSTAALTIPTTNGGGGTPSAVPEPSTIILFLTGLAGIGLFGFTQRRSVSYV